MESASLDPVSRTPSSLARNSVFRLMADVGNVTFGVASTVVTARVLGPSDKGTLSTLLLVGILLSYACSLGFGDAVIVTAAGDRERLRRGVPASLATILLVLPIGLLVLAGVSMVADWGSIATLIIVAAVMLPFTTFAHVLSGFHNALERIGFTSFVSVVVTGVTALTILGLAAAERLTLLTAASANLGGWAIGTVILARGLIKEEVTPRPVWDRGYVRGLIKLGVTLEISYLLVALTQRLDLLIVYALVGEAAAGVYTVALTIAQLVGYVPLALAGATFPRIASLPEVDVVPLIAKASRITLASSILVAAALEVATPVIVPFLFGHAYDGALAPLLVLVPSIVLWSEQWTLARAAAARGHANLYLTSFSASLITMLACNLVLIPRFGITGAAWASAAAGVVGLGICIVGYRRHPTLSPVLAQGLPNVADFRELIGLPLRVARAGADVLRLRQGGFSDP